MLPLRLPPVRASIGASVVFALAACTTPPPPAKPAPATPAPASPLATAEAAPSAPAKSEPEIPPEKPVRALDPAAAPVVAQLARQLHVRENDVTVAQVARAEWPNACLGLAAEGEICAQVITPGYAVSLVVNDQRYEFRTDTSGRRIRLAFAPLEETGEPLLTWYDTTSFSVLVIGTERVKFGLRGAPMLVAPLPLPEQAGQLAGMLSRFAPFYARTVAGEVTFRGVGTGRPSPTEQRQIAEWARLAWTEAENGLNRPAVDRAFVWRRQGGVAGFCDEVIVDRAGTATAWTCRRQEDAPAASVTLSLPELEQLYRWIDTLSPVAWSNDEGGATPDALKISLTLDGQGTKALSESEREHMLDFANALVRRLVTSATP